MNSLEGVASDRSLIDSTPILFSGLTASSKSNISKLIAKSMDRPWFDATSQLLQLVDVRTDEKSVWTTDVADAVQSAREGDELDKELDRLLMLKLESTPDAVVDAWAAPWLWEKEAVRVFVTADEETRIRRCLASYPAHARPTINEARELIQAKDNYTRELFSRLYGFDLFADHSNFDVILDTSGFQPDTAEKSGVEIARERTLPMARHAIELTLGIQTWESSCDVLGEAVRAGVVQLNRLP